MEMDLRGNVGVCPGRGGGRPCSPEFFSKGGSLDSVEASRELVADGSAASTCMDFSLDLHGINHGLLKDGGLHSLPSVFLKQGVEVVGLPLPQTLDSDCAMENMNSAETGVLTAQVQAVPIDLASACPPVRGVPICTQGACEIADSNSPSLGISGVAQNTSASSQFSHLNALLHVDKIVMGSMVSGMSKEGYTPGAHPFASTKAPTWNGLDVVQEGSAPSTKPKGNVWSRPMVIPLPPVEMAVEVRDGVDRVQLDPVEVCATVKRFDSALVGRLFGKRIPFAFLNTELHKRWQGFGPFRLITISGDCFVCIFDTMASRDAVLIGGPWIVAGQVLGIDSWSPEFSPSSKIGIIMPVWVRLPGLPLYCWGGKNIARIARGLGEPIWVDVATDRLERGLFARVCIRVDLSKALKPGLWVDGPYGSFFQKVEYEGLSSFCFVCGHVGHKAHNCTMVKAKQDGCAAMPMTEAPTVGEAACKGGGSTLDVHEQVLLGGERSMSSVAKELCLSDVNSDLERGFGPWMIVQRRSRQSHASRKGAVAGQPIFSKLASSKGGQFPASKRLDREGFMGSASGDPPHGKGTSSTWRPKGRASSERELFSEPLSGPKEQAEPSCSGADMLPSGSITPIFTGFSATGGRAGAPQVEGAKGRSSRTIKAQLARASRTHKARMIGDLGPIALEPRKRRKA